MSKHVVSIFEEGTIRKTIEIGSAHSSAAQPKLEAHEDYKVVAMEDSH
jgi:hypothetical protein